MFLCGVGNSTAMELKKYRDWEILKTMPFGWGVDKTAGSPIANSVFITNGKSVLKGQKRAILLVNSEPIKHETKQVVVKTVTIEKDEDFIFPSKTVNNLARKKFQEQLLKEIQFDLMVCEVEGWDKKEYLKELQVLLNSIDVSVKKKSNNNNKSKAQLDIFDIIPK